jgi:two-component system alkaline phosphatase synthesis response regulator PhoP
MMAQYSVLIVDDDVKIAALLQAYFTKEGFRTFTAHDGERALLEVREHKPDIMVLDLMLPGIDGWEICRRLRRDNDIPIIMLTARDDETDRLIGLEIGADDYVTKPFSPREVVARAKVILRRAHRVEGKSEPLKIAGLLIDVEQHVAAKDGVHLDLTPTEFKILELLAGSPGRVFSRLQIVEQVQGYAFEGYERTIDAHIKNIRRKIEANPKEPQFIQTIYGVGYKFVGEKHA